MGVCNCSMYCCTLLYAHSSIAIILMGKRELIALLNLSSWCLVMVERLFFSVPRGSLQFVIVVFPDHTHLLFLGPLLFLLYINDLPENIQSQVRLFADDTAVYLTVTNMQDSQVLQSDLESLQHWERTWDIEFNPGKMPGNPYYPLKKPG